MVAPPPRFSADHPAPAVNPEIALFQERDNGASALHDATQLCVIVFDRHACACHRPSHIARQPSSFGTIGMIGGHARCAPLPPTHHLRCTAHIRLDDGKTPNSPLDSADKVAYSFKAPATHIGDDDEVFSLTRVASIAPPLGHSGVPSYSSVKQKSEHNQKNKKAPSKAHIESRFATLITCYRHPTEGS